MRSEAMAPIMVIEESLETKSADEPRTIAL
jgi:hypothetical protein